MSSEERPQFDTAAAALEEFLARMLFAASPQHMAEAIVDELPWNGWKIVKMSDAERDAWEEFEQPWDETPVDRSEIREIRMPSQPWFTAGPVEDDKEDMLWPSS